jgi:hypothetical protein
MVLSPFVLPCAHGWEHPCTTHAQATAHFLLKLRSAGVRQAGLGYAMADQPINDYYVITSRLSGLPERWGWEIRRKSQPLGVKMTGDGCQSDTAAQFAGKQALAEFLIELSKEEKRK